MKHSGQLRVHKKRQIVLLQCIPGALSRCAKAAHRLNLDGNGNRSKAESVEAKLPLAHDRPDQMAIAN